MAGMKKDQQEDEDIKKHIIGTCLGMCPNAELRIRQRERLLHPLERSIDTRGGGGRPEPRAMVKEFSRSAAGHHIKPSDVRPLPILVKTTKYLFTNVCCREDVSWALIYQFVFDRLRAVRQDLCVQGIREEGLGVLQAAVRFYVYAQYRTCEHDLCDFDPYLNMKHLAETLSLVITLYRESAKENTAVKSRNICGVEDISSFVQCDTCDRSSDESSYSDDSDSESDDVNESKITQDAVASEKVNSASKEAPESEGSAGTDTTTNVTEERGERCDSDEGSGSSDPCKNTTTTVMVESGGGVDEEQEQQQEREEQQRREREKKDKEEEQEKREEQQKREREKKNKEEERQKRERKREKLRCEMLKYSPREEAEALNLLVNFGHAEAIMHVLKLPREIRESRLVWTSLQMNLAWLNNNYHRVLRLAPLLPTLCLLAFYNHLTTVQRRALSILSCGHGSRGGLMYSGEDLAASLRFPSVTTLLDACTHYGLNTTHTDVIFTKASFNHEAPLMKTTRVDWIDERLASVSLGDLLLPSSQYLSQWLAG